MKSSVVLSVLVIVFALPCLADDAENVRLATAMVGAISARDLAALDGVVSTNVVRHSAATPGVVITNLAEFRAFSAKRRVVS